MSIRDASGEVLKPAPDNGPIVAIVASTLRGCLQLASGLGIAIGSYSDSQLTVVASLLVGITMLVWSGWQKIQSARANRAASLMSATLSAKRSADAGMPLPIVVTATEPASD